MLVRPEKGHDFSLRINGFKKLAAGAYFCSAAELFVVGKKSFPFFKACFFGIFSESGIKRAGLVRFSDSDQFLQRHPVYRAFERCGEVNVTRGIVYCVEEGKRQKHLGALEKFLHRRIPAGNATL